MGRNPILKMIRWIYAATDRTPSSWKALCEAEFEEIFGRVKAKGLPYGSAPYNHTEGQIYTRRGGRGFYFEDPNGHLLEVMTVRETGS
jgi:catechol 2,3-dioxygenase-like lactoylglutathione lyase family enzyme